MQSIAKVFFRVLDKLKRTQPWQRRRQLEDAGARLLLQSPLLTHGAVTSSVRKNAVRVDQPLILISQIKRSGGTLLSQLFDGHPQCYAHPDELKIGKPHTAWPKFDPSEKPQTTFNRLFEPNAIKASLFGYHKSKADSERRPFVFAGALQKAIFVDEVRRASAPTQRDYLNAYFTAYFNGWLNYQTAYSEKKVVTGFTPGLLMRPESVADYFAAYPDGRMVSVIRDPMNWFPSAKTHNDWTAPELVQSINGWRRSAKAMQGNKSRYGDRYIVLRFDRLVLETERTMRQLAGVIGIDFDPILTVPTFNTVPIMANSSFKFVQKGVVPDSVKRESILSDEESRMIAAELTPLYQKVSSLALT